LGVLPEKDIRVAAGDQAPFFSEMGGHLKVF